jgi:hypothetical protein
MMALRRVIMFGNVRNRLLITLMFSLLACWAPRPVQPPPSGPDVNARRQPFNLKEFFIGQL